jgi:AcrR family transcriptional regulator
VNAEGYWQQSRQAVREKVVETGMQLFLEQGFDATTTTQIAAEVGISSRSLFRYVATKEDLVLGHLEPQGEVVATALAARPDGESPWDALRAALDSLRGPGYDEDHQLKLTKMIYASPSLRARYMDKRMSWIELLAPEIARRLHAAGAAGSVPEADLDLSARAIVGTSLTCLTLAAEKWAAQDGKVDLGDLYDTAIAAVRGRE